MHELSIVYGIISAVEEAAKKANAKRVYKVAIRVGALSGVAQDALQFGYEAVTVGTLLEGSELAVQLQPVVIYCDNCESERELPSVQSFRCPACNRPSGKIVRGRELDLESIEIEQNETIHDDTHC